jgi:hypothetical protein
MACLQNRCCAARFSSNQLSYEEVAFHLEDSASVRGSFNSLEHAVMGATELRFWTVCAKGGRVVVTRIDRPTRSLSDLQELTCANG